MFRNYVLSMLGSQPFHEAHDDAGGGSGTDGGDDSGDQDSDGDNDDSGEGDDSKDDKQDKITFTEEQQKHINSLINQKVKQERTKAEQERKKQEERAKMDAAEKAKAELEDAQEKINAYNNRVLDYEIKDVAREMGIPSKKLARFMRVVDRDGLEVDADGSVDQTAVKAAVESVLSDMPEFKAPETTKGPGADFSGGGEKAKYSMAQIDAMTPQEIAKNYDDVMASMTFHQNK